MEAVSPGVFLLVVKEDPGPEQMEAARKQKWRGVARQYPSMTPDQQAEADEVEHAIQHCLNNLPLEFKTVVVMADIQGMDYAEVAVAARAPLGTIKSRLARARLRLRLELQRCADLLPEVYSGVHSILMPKTALCN